MLLILMMTFSFLSFADCEKDAYLPTPEIVQVSSWDEISSHIPAGTRTVIQISERKIPFIDGRPYLFKSTNDPEFIYNISTYYNQEDITITVFQPWVRPKRFILKTERFELYNFIPFKLNGNYGEFENHYMNIVSNFGEKYSRELFETLYQVKGSSFKEHASYSEKHSITQIAKQTKSKRVLGLAIHPQSNRMLEFSGYSHGVVKKKNGIEYLEVYIERESFYISLNNILSLKAAVY